MLKEALDDFLGKLGVGGEVVGEGLAFRGETDFCQAKNAFACFVWESSGVGRDANDGALNFWHGEEGVSRDSEEDLRVSKECNREREEAVFPILCNNPLGDFFLNHEDDFVGCGVDGNEEADDFPGNSVGDVAENGPLSEL